MNVEIITIGDEILIGQIVDTNSAWMAKRLNVEGFSVTKITTVGDDADAIKKNLSAAMEKTDIVLITGGLGPTKDDITKETLSEYFNSPLVLDENVYAHIEKILSRSNLSMNELNRSQAFVPKSATVINNEQGTAPITWFEKNGKVVVSLPGVPMEMEWAMTEEIIPRLKKKFNPDTLIHRHFLVYGYPESVLAIKLEEWEKALPSYIHLAYLPALGLVRLRISAVQQETDWLEKEIDEQVQKLRAILGNAILTEEDITLPELVGKLLKEKGMTLATAESCTGGNIAHFITSVPGSSEYFKGGIVAYNNNIKMELLNVSPDDIEDYGVVSLPVVEQMAKGALELLEADIAVATSGIAGPKGGTDDKPVGTVCIAVATKDAVKGQQFVFGTQRNKNIMRATVAALAMIKEAIH